MMYTVFTTQGLIPIEAFTHFGVNAKPNTKNPIGYFGTGLKYAIAVLVRHNIPVTLWIGRHKYVFTASEEDFRGKEFTFITLKRAKGTFFTKTALPFTTELGKGWSLWQAFRELYANTLDEGGTCSWADYSDNIIQEIAPNPHETLIVVESDEFAQIAQEKDKYFLPQGEKVWKGGKTVEIFPKQSDAIYYRTMRAYELPKEYSRSMYTYNMIYGQELTEDRTFKNLWWVLHQIAQFVVESDDEEFIRNILRASKDTLEGHLDFDSLDTIPSETFQRVFRSLKPQASGGGGGYVYSRMSSYVERVAPEKGHQYLVSPAAFCAEMRMLAQRDDFYGVKRIVEQNRDFFIRVMEECESKLKPDLVEQEN